MSEEKEICLVTVGETGRMIEEFLSIFERPYTSTELDTIIKTVHTHRIKSICIEAVVMGDLIMIPPKKGTEDDIIFVVNPNRAKLLGTDKIMEFVQKKARVESLMRETLDLE